MQRLKLDPKVQDLLKTDLMAAMYLTKGQPHLRTGLPLLWRDGGTRFYLVMLLAASMLITVDVTACLKNSTSLIFGGLVGWLATGRLGAFDWFVPVATCALGFAAIGILANLVWSAIAKHLADPDRPHQLMADLVSGRTLMVSILGVVPLRMGIGTLWLPRWFHLKCWEKAGTASGYARIAHILALAWSVEDSTPNEATLEQRLHNALKSQGPWLLDALGSYLYVPGILVAVLTTLVALAIHPISTFITVGMLQVGITCTVLMWLINESALLALFLDALFTHTE